MVVNNPEMEAALIKTGNDKRIRIMPGAKIRDMHKMKMNTENSGTMVMTGAGNNLDSNEWYQLDSDKDEKRFLNE